MKEILFGIHLAGWQAWAQFWSWTLIFGAMLWLWVRVTNKRERGRE